MSTEEKAAAFDLLFIALTNRWHDGKWTANCTSLVDQPKRDTVEECLPDLLAWAERVAKYQEKKRAIA